MVLHGILNVGEVQLGTLKAGVARCQLICVEWMETHKNKECWKYKTNTTGLLLQKEELE